MFRVSELPRITFAGSELEETLDLAQSSGRIRHIAGVVSGITEEGATVGIIFQTGPGLVLAWLGVLAAGRVPLILQYPNEKISKAYWKESLRDTVARCGVGALLCATELAAYGPEELGPCLLLDVASLPSEGEEEIVFPVEGEILQLSSGTTGFKKPIRFSFAALRRHTVQYNNVLGLTSEDRIVSWLPLYHDMGFIACFITPLMLGVPVVMIDPMTWVKRPGMLFEAIVRHGGTICYMPNFGFEVMAKGGKAGPFPTMRRWVSCSEPTYAATLERFVAATGAELATVCTCYAMAENVFAVTQSEGMRLIEREGQRYVSCGRAIPGTEIKLVEGELYVRSSHSLTAYVGSGDQRDKDGFYATGDLGFVEDGEVVITGRKQDLANVAGKKFLLNDLDFMLGQIFTQSAGRIASLAVFDAAGGTEKVLFLIEADDFWIWDRKEEPVRLIREVTGVEWLEVHFVPRHFISKTSSGKINRKKTLADWRACRSEASGRGAAVRTAAELARELGEQFPGIAKDRAVEEELDSLGRLILRVFCEQHGVEYRADLTLDGIAAAGARAEEAPKSEVFSIVALMDGWRLGFDAPEPFVTEEYLEAIAQEVGRPVHFEHICVPPALILFSDLMFHDYFMAKNPDPAYEAVAALLRKIKSASLILIDDEDNFRTPPYCAYPVLDRQFTMAADADLLGHRLQRYTQSHHLLPRGVVAGREILPGSVNGVLQLMESYLQTPILRIAFHEEYRAYTEGWEFCDYRGFATDAEKTKGGDWLGRFQGVLLEFLRRKKAEFRMTAGEAKNRFVLMDLPHFCSFLLNRPAVDFVVERYSSFCIVGLPSSLPYLTKRLDELGKPYFFSTQTTPEREDYECLVLTGGVGGYMPETNKPTYDFVHAREEGHGGGRPHNVAKDVAEACPPLAACDETLFRAVIGRHGVLIGNYLLNHTKQG